MLYDGSTPRSTELGQFCGKDIADPILTSGPSLYLEFISDYVVTRPGFKIKVSSVHGKRDFVSFKGILSFQGCIGLFDRSFIHGLGQ